MCVLSKSNKCGGKKTSSYFILEEKKPLPPVFNCIFFGAKVIINFALGDTHEPETIILLNSILPFGPKISA